MAEIRAVELTVIAALMASFSVAALGQGSAPVVVPDLTLPAFAQEKISVIDRAHPEYDEVGYQFGPYILKPTISAAESVDSNILGSSSFERSDFITTIKPTISLDSDWTSDAIGFYAEGDVAQYARYTSENVGNLIVRGDGRWDIDRGQTLAINAGYQVQHEDRYSPESQAAVSQAGGGTYAKYPTEYSLTNGGLTYVYSPSRLGFEVQATVNKYDYTNEPTLNGGLAIENDRSRVEYAITPRVSYELIPGYQAFIEGWANRHEYDSTFDATQEHLKRSSTGYAVATGTQINLGDLLTGEVYVGYQNQDYDDRRLSTNSGVYLGASVLWNVTALTSLRFTASRSVQETILVGSSGFWDTELNATVEHELLRNIILTAGVSYSINDYQGIARDDSTISGNFGGRWKLTQIYSIGLSGVIQHRSSNLDDNSFTRAIVAVDFKAAF